MTINQKIILWNWQIKFLFKKGLKFWKNLKNFINDYYEGKFELLNFAENVEAAKVIIKLI